MKMVMVIVVVVMMAAYGGDGHDSDTSSDGGVEILEYLWHPCCLQDMANK